MAKAQHEPHAPWSWRGVIQLKPSLLRQSTEVGRSARTEASPGDLERAARTLRADAPFATVLCVFDWLLHVGIADSKFVEPERLLLGGVAALLGLSQEEYRRRCEWYLKIDPSVPIELAPGTRTCAACGTSFTDDARFCGGCGASLGA